VASATPESIGENIKVGLCRLTPSNPR
jgi:hypothetical protein